MSKSRGSSNRGAFNAGAKPVISGGKKMVAEGYRKARGATRRAVGRR